MLQGVGTQAVKVTSVVAATLTASGGPSASYVLVADEGHLYVIQHGTVVLVLPTPDTITAVCVCLHSTYSVFCVCLCMMAFNIMTIENSVLETV